MPTVQQAYKLIEDLEQRLNISIKKSLSDEHNFQAYADFSKGYLNALGKEVDFSIVEKAVRDAPVMYDIWHRLDKVAYSYNSLVNEIALIRRDGIAKSIVSYEGADEVSTLNSCLRKYGINPIAGTFTLGEYIISQTKKRQIEFRYLRSVLVQKELLIPDNMNISDFILLIKKEVKADVL